MPPQPLTAAWRTRRRVRSVSETVGIVSLTPSPVGTTMRPCRPPAMSSSSRSTGCSRSTSSGRTRCSPARTPPSAAGARRGYRLTIASARRCRGPHGERAAARQRPAAGPAGDGDRHARAARRRRVQRGPPRPGADVLDPRRRTACAPTDHGVQRHVPRCRGRPARRTHRHHPLGPGRPAGTRVPGDHRRRRPDLPARRRRVDLSRGHRRHRPRAGAGRGRPRRRRRPERRPLAGDVPPPPRRTEPVRHVGVVAPGRPGGGPRRADRDRGRAGRRTIASRCSPTPRR